MTDPILYDSHVHSPLCGHTIGAIESYAWKAWRRNLRGLCFTCHNPMPNGYSPNTRMGEKDLPKYVDLIEGLQKDFGRILDIKLGLECDYFPGFEDFLREQVGSEGFDYILGSVHPFFPEYKSRYKGNTPLESQETYFDLLGKAAETGIYDCLAHPDLIKCVTPSDWAFDDMKEPVYRCLDRIAATGIALELNTSGLYKQYAEMNPGPEFLLGMHERGIPVVLGSDSHQPERVGDFFEGALELLSELGFTEVNYFEKRERKTVPIKKALGSLVPA